MTELVGVHAQAELITNAISSGSAALNEIGLQGFKKLVGVEFDPDVLAAAEEAVKRQDELFVRDPNVGPSLVRVCDDHAVASRLDCWLVWHLCRYLHIRAVILNQAPLCKAASASGSCCIRLSFHWERRGTG